MPVGMGLAVVRFFKIKEGKIKMQVLGSVSKS